APMLPPSPEAGPRFLELSLEDAPGTAEAGPMLAPANAPAELPILGVESVLLADSAGAGELGSPAEVASPDSPGNPPYIDLFADEGAPATSPPAGEDSRADEAHGSPGQLGQLAGPDEELPPAEAGPLLLALEELAEHPPPEVFHPQNPFVAPAARSVPRAPLFSDLSPEAFVELVERCPLRRFRGGGGRAPAGEGGAALLGPLQG